MCHKLPFLTNERFWFHLRVGNILLWCTCTDAPQKVLYHPYWSDWLSCKQTNLTSTYGVLWVIIISMSQKIIEYLEASNRNTTCVANVSKFSVYIKLLTKMNGMFLCSRPPRTYHFFKNRMSHWHIGRMGITGKNHKLWLLWYVNKICSWSGWNKIIYSDPSIQLQIACWWPPWKWLIYMWIQRKIAMLSWINWICQF